MHFGYVLTGIEDLVNELKKPLTRISACCTKDGQPMYVTLWREDGMGLVISSEVHDAAERLEIGNLRFAIEPSPSEIDPFFIERDYPAPFSVTDELKVVKLTIFESGSSADGGVVLIDQFGKRLAILAAAFPFCIATRGLSPEIDRFASEYELENYRAEFL